jgi:hypothetical protein
LDSLLTHLDKWRPDLDPASDDARAKRADQVKQRAKSVIGNLKTARAADHLYALAREGVVNADNVAVWKKIRNSIQHGDWSGTEKEQEFHDGIGHLVVLLYQLIFRLIDYQGRQTDWGTTGWPLIKYPPKPT